MPSHTTTGIILAVVVVSVVCIIACLHYHRDRGKKWRGPSQCSQTHSSKTRARSTPIIPSLRHGIPGASNFSPSVAPSPSHNRPPPARQATPPQNRQPKESPQPQQPPQTHSTSPQPLRPPARIIIPPPVAGGLYGLKGVFPQPKRGGR
ncbi:hypothetical protein OCU04_012056 [Sclerotinia nivalis]|uniref:Uncharacterized protein n=1 Tax=Sclerotinia nivalis TaxID=352851 RepID=A0A9X0AA44_9HELO|nr:hypothetical protein OCU04_012056 [Sclerotinia nivalis]